MTAARVETDNEKKRAALVFGAWQPRIGNFMQGVAIEHLLHTELLKTSRDGQLSVILSSVDSRSIDKVILEAS